METWMPDSASGGSAHMIAAEVIDWMGILVLGAGLIVPLLLLGHGLIGFLLYWWSGKGEEQSGVCSGVEWTSKGTRQPRPTSSRPPLH